MLAELLKLFGIVSHFAHSAQEAWSMINKQRFDLYALDAWLPRQDGFQFCRQLRTVDLETPIVFYSGAAYGTDKQTEYGRELMLTWSNPRLMDSLR